MERKPTLTTIAIDKLHPHPQNPRKVIGNIYDNLELLGDEDNDKKRG